MVALIRMYLLAYIDIYRFLEEPEKSWKQVYNQRKKRYKNLLFPTLGLFLKLQQFNELK